MTESQLRRLATTMRLLEDGLDEIATALMSPRERTMTVVQDDIPKSILPSMLELIAQLANQIQKMKFEYGLASQVFSNRKRFLAKLSSLSIDLTEATSRYMVGFGEVPEKERGPLDSRLSAMIALVEELATMLTAAAQDT